MAIPWETVRYFDAKGNKARVTYHPEWSQSRPWVSYVNGTAGRHFETSGLADSHFQALGYKKETNAPKT